MKSAVNLLSVFALYFFTEESVSILFGSMVLVSLTAMLWNLIFNYFLDKVFTGPREKRGVIFRTLHAISFEGGLLIFTVPIIAYFLKVDWITAFMMDFSLTDETGNSKKRIKSAVKISSVFDRTLIFLGHKKMLFYLLKFFY